MDKKEEKPIIRNISQLKPYKRQGMIVRFNQDRLDEMDLMTIHCASDLPIVRYADRISKGQKDKDVVIKNTLTWNEAGKGPVEQKLTISYGKGAPSKAIYNIVMALNWYLQKRSFNPNRIVTDGINWICKLTGSDSRTVESDLRKLTHVHFSGENIVYHKGSGKYLDLDMVPYPVFIRDKEARREVLIEVSTTWLSYIQNNLIYTAETYQKYFSLKSILAKLLFTRLAKHFRPVFDPGMSYPTFSNSFFRMNVMKLANQLLLENPDPYEVKRSFERATEELLKIGFLRDDSLKVDGKKLEFFEKFYDDERRVRYLVNFHKSIISPEVYSWLKLPDAPSKNRILKTT